MTQEELKGYIEAAIDDGNYLSAYMTLQREKQKDGALGEQEVIDFTGRIVERIIDDLSRLPKRENRERIVYLRSLLVWIFKDVPGLSGVYREQLRILTGQTGPIADLLKTLNLRGVSNITGNEDAVADEVEDVVDTIKQNLEDVAEKVRTGDVNEQVRDFFTAAESGVRQGIRQLNDVLRSFNRPPNPPKE